MSEQEVLPPLPPADAGQPTSSMAVISLVAGVLTWFSLPLAFLVVPTPICTLAAIICGHMARAEIRRRPGMKGDGMAIAGLVLGWGMVAVIVIAIVAVLLLFGTLAAFLAWAGASGNLN